MGRSRLDAKPMISVTQCVRRLSRLLLVLPLVAALAGCGAGIANQSTAGKLIVAGHVHGGSQPVAGATIQLFAAGTGGNGSQATDILSQPVITDANSYFSLTGDYTCNSPTEQVYLVARGGNPGFTSNVDNHALVLVSALGSCVDLINNAHAFVYVDEVSTVAAAYALAPFMTSFDHVGASATNTVGLTNAFLNAQLLANSSNGQSSSLPSNLAIEQGKLYSLANAIAACVNSDGGSACTPLFTAATPAGASAPRDVLGALLNIVKHPGSNVARVFNTIAPTPPFGGGLTRAPHDWTMSMTVTGGGLWEPTALAVDGSGNVWVANFGGPVNNGPNTAGNAGDLNNPLGVVAYTPQGTPFSAAPFAATQQTEVYGLTLDRNGDVWVTSEENIGHNGTFGSIAKIAGASSANTGALLGVFSDDTIDFPESIASDPSTGNIIVGNYAGSTATVYDIHGNFVKNVGAGYAVFPDDVTSDGAGGVWIANQGYYTITHVPASGTPQVIHCCREANTIALDPQGNVWVTNFGTLSTGEYTISEVSPTGNVLINNEVVPGLSTPGGAAVDAGGQFWVLNYHSGSLLGIAGNNTGVTPGTPLSPVPLGSDAKLIEPFSIAPDPSGNLWVSNRAKNNVVMFFGLATPTATPSAARATAP